MPLSEYILPASQLGGTVFTVLLFLKYLRDINTNQVIRDKESIIASNRQSDTNITLAVALEKLSNTITTNNAVNLKNTEVIKKNVSATETAAGAIKENTETIKQKTNGNGS